MARLTLRRGAKITVPLAATALLLAGCASGSQASEGGYSTDTINSLLNTDPSTFDPAKAHAADDYTVSRVLYDSLTRRDDDNKLAPGLAESWQTKSATDYVFTIRSGAKCGDDTPITPSVVAGSLTYFANSNSTFKALVFGPSTPTVTADDAAGTVEIRLEKPWSEVPTGLSLAQTGIICPAGIADPAGLDKGTVPGAFSGPYQLAAHTPGVTYKFTLRDGYSTWPKFATPLTGTPAKTLNFGITKDSTTTANQLQSGDLDIANVPDSNVTRFDNQKYQLAKVDLAGAYIIFNERSTSPFSDAKGGQALRTAVAEALDRKAFDQALNDGRGDLYTTIASNKFACTLQDESLLKPQDKTAASSALAGVTIRLAGTTIMGPKGAANVYVQQALTEAGANVQLMNEDNATWASRTQKQVDTWDMTVMGDINATGTMAASLTRVMSTAIEKGGRNFGGADNPAGVAALNTALEATTDDSKCAAYKESQKTVLERVDVVPLAGILNNYVQRQGFSVRAFSGYLDPASMRIVG